LLPVRLNVRMELPTNDAQAHVLRRIGPQPIVLAAATLIIIVVGIGFTILWRAYAGISPEQDRAASVRLLQARTAQASEQLVEKTKGLETTQQESIDQLQVMQDQLQSMKHLLAGQQADTKRLSDQVGGLTSAINTLRQSFASAQAPETSSTPSTRHAAIRTRPHATKRQSADTHRKPAKSRT
jgi:uncharacterized protein HemX